MIYVSPTKRKADALRLLEASRSVVNTLLTQLWPRLDDFAGERPGSAWKQVVSMTISPDPHGDRQFRCEAKAAGRILRAQVERKQVFGLIRPILSDGFIRPKTEKRPAGKNRATIKEAIAALSKTLAEDVRHIAHLPSVRQASRNLSLSTGASSK